MWASVQAATTLPSSRSQEDIASAAVKSAYESYTAALTQQGRGGTGVAWAADEYRRLLVEANWAILESRAPRLRLLVRKNLAAIEAGRGGETNSKSYSHCSVFLFLLVLSNSAFFSHTI